MTASANGLYFQTPITIDPSVTGLDGPPGAIALRVSGGVVSAYGKFGTGMTDWSLLTGGGSGLTIEGPNLAGAGTGGSPLHLTSVGTPTLLGEWTASIAAGQSDDNGDAFITLFTDAGTRVRVPTIGAVPAWIGTNLSTQVVIAVSAELRLPSNGDLVVPLAGSITARVTVNSIVTALTTVLTSSTGATALGTDTAAIAGSSLIGAGWITSNDFNTDDDTLFVIRVWGYIPTAREDQ